MQELSAPGRAALPPGDYLIRARPGAAGAPYARLLRDAGQALERISLREDPS